MIDFESDQVVHEVLASLPFTFGFVPRESVVVTALAFGERHVTIGASARVDLADMFLAAAVPHADHVLAALGRTRAGGGVVTIHTDREVGPWVVDLAGLLTPRWPFAEHGGYYVLARGWIHGFGPDGVPRGRQDALELLTTRVAMSEPARSFVDGPEGFRIRRSLHGRTATKVAAALARCGPSHALPASHWVRLTAAWHDAVESGGPHGTEARAELLHAVEHVPFRDGVLAWAAGGNAGRVEDLTVIARQDVFATPRRPNRALLDQVCATLGRVARHAPEGAARAPLAMAAYLAWWAGDGARARVLGDQAREEDSTYSLTELVQDAIARACPPPWYARTLPLGIEPRSSSPYG